MEGCEEGTVWLTTNSLNAAGTIRGSRVMALTTCIHAPNGNIYVVPLSIFARIAYGEMPLSQLESHEEIVRAILKDWMQDLLTRETAW